MQKVLRGDLEGNENGLFQENSQHTGNSHYRLLAKEGAQAILQYQHQLIFAFNEKCDVKSITVNKFLIPNNFKQKLLPRCASADVVQVPSSVFIFSLQT